MQYKKYKQQENYKRQITNYLIVKIYKIIKTKLYLIELIFFINK